MLGMMFVNYLAGCKYAPYIFKHHHDYCSYADTIMPQFLFAVGFAMRLSLGKRIATGGKMPWGRAVRRILGLALVAIIWYAHDSFPGYWKRLYPEPLEPGGPLPPGEPIVTLLYFLFKRELLQTLLHIAITSLWILPVITLSWQVRFFYAVFSGLLHVVLSYWFAFAWVFSDPVGIDGGPLGFLTWAVPALAGSLACDAVRSKGVAATAKIALSGVVVMLIGWLMSFPTTLYNVHGDENEVAAAAAAQLPPRPERNSEKPFISVLDPRKFPPDPVLPTMDRIKKWDGTFVELPFVPPPKEDVRRWNYWMMSQRGGTLSYPTFAAGVSLVIYALFLWACDGLGFRLGIFRTLGTNSLVAYCMHPTAWHLCEALKLTQYFPKDNPSYWVMFLGFAVTTLIVYVVCRFLEYMGWYIRV